MECPHTERVVVSSALTHEITVAVRISTEELMEPPQVAHTPPQICTLLSADPTIFAKLRIKSEKADAKPSASISLNG